MNFYKSGAIFLRTLYKHLLLIIIVTVLIGSAVTGYAFLKIKPSYTASSKLSVKVETTNNSGNSDETLNVALANKLFPTIEDRIRSPKIIDYARGYSGDQEIYANRIGISYNENSLILTISYVDKTEKLAKGRLRFIIDTIKEELPKQELTAVSRIEFVETQLESNLSSSSKIPTYIIAGFVGGLICAVMIVLLIFVLDNKVKDKDEVELLTGTNLIAVISK